MTEPKSFLSVVTVSQESTRTKEKEQTVKAIFITYVVVLATIPAVITTAFAFVLGGWRLLLGFLVTWTGIYLMLFGAYLAAKWWVVRREERSAIQNDMV